MCLYIFHLLISYLDRRCCRGPDHGGVCYKVQDLESGLSSWDPKRRRPGHVPPPASHQHHLPRSISRCSLCNTTASPISWRSGQMFGQSSLPPFAFAGPREGGRGGISFAHWPCRCLPETCLSFRSHSAPSMFPILNQCFPQRSNALMGQICSLRGKHVVPCQTRWEQVVLHHGHLVTSWGSHP